MKLKSFPVAFIFFMINSASSAPSPPSPSGASQAPAPSSAPPSSTSSPPPSSASAASTGEKLHLQTRLSKNSGPKRCRETVTFDFDEFHGVLLPGVGLVDLHLLLHEGVELRGVFKPE